MDNSKKRSILYTFLKKIELCVKWNNLGRVFTFVFSDDDYARSFWTFPTRKSISCNWILITMVISYVDSSFSLICCSFCITIYLYVDSFYTDALLWQPQIKNHNAIIQMNIQHSKIRIKKNGVHISTNEKHERRGEKSHFLV